MLDVWLATADTEMLGVFYPTILNVVASASFFVFISVEDGRMS